MIDPISTAWNLHKQTILKNAVRQLSILDRWVAIPIPNTVEELMHLKVDIAVSMGQRLSDKLAELKGAVNAAPFLGKVASKIPTLPAFDEYAWSTELRRSDRSRLVRVVDVMDALTKWEEEMISEKVGSPMYVYVRPWKKAAATIGFINKNWRDIWRILVSIAEGGEETIEAVALLLIHSATVSTAASVVDVYRSSLSIRNKACDRIRKAALPQRSGPRRHARKRTRL